MGQGTAPLSMEAVEMHWMKQKAVIFFYYNKDSMLNTYDYLQFRI